MPLKRFLLIALSVCLGISACSDTGKDKTVSASSEPPQPQEITTRQEPDEDSAELQRVNALADRLHQQALNAGNRLLSAVNQLAMNTDNAHLATARDRWLEAHQTLQSLWPLYQLDKPRTLLVSSQPETGFSFSSLLDATPMLPGYLDTVPGYPDSGITHAPGLELSATLLQEKHQYADPLFLTFGLHPIEFMLWSESGLTADIRRLEATPESQQKQSDQEQVAVEPGTTKRRLLLIQLMALQYPVHLSQLYAKWRELHFSRLLAAKGSVQNQAQVDQDPVLETIMKYIDAQILGALKPTQDEPGWVYQEHMAYSLNSQSFWQGRMTGLIEVLGLLSLNEGEALKLTTDLSTCVVGLDPVSTDIGGDVHACETMALALREKVIILFAYSHK